MDTREATTKDLQPNTVLPHPPRWRSRSGFSLGAEALASASGAAKQPSLRRQHAVWLFITGAALACGALGGAANEDYGETDEEESSSSASSGEASEEGSAATVGAEDDSKPSCTDLRTGTQQAIQYESVLCTAATPSVVVRISAGGLVESIGGSACTFLEPGYECYETNPDEYLCGGCQFRVQAETLDGRTPVVWTIAPSSCQMAGCAAYCCTDDGIVFGKNYALQQRPPGSSSGSSGGSACSECISSCRGLPSCCTGTGCICDSACP